MNKLICGDNVEVMKTLPSESVDLVVTSPPYDDLRTYGGHSWDFEGVAQELTRLLKPGGVIVWNVADGVIDGFKSLTSMRQALYFDSIGIKMHDSMIYEKSGVAYPDCTRYLQVAEFVWVMSKGKPKTINLLRDRPNKYVGKMGGNKRGGLCERGEFGIRFNVWRYSNGRDNSTKDRCSHDHPAIMPEGLAKDHIASWSNPNDIVLDPFSGSGTTLKAAKELGRQYVGIEINPDYIKICEKRLAQEYLALD